MATGNIGRNIVFDIKNADGTSFHGLVLNKSTFDSVVMSLGDKITGDVYYKDNTLAVTMQEYIEYKKNPNDANEEPVKYVLVSPPTIIREGMVEDNGDLKGMTKYSFTFYHPMYMLSNFPFTDVAVTDDERRYLSENKTFSWAGRGVDFLAKINKNLQGTQWFVATSQDAESIAKLNKMPDEIAPTKSDDATKSNVLTFDKNTIADALKTTYDTWTVPFVIESIKPYEYFDDDNNDYYEQGKRFVILFGLPSNEILRPSSEPFSDSVSADTRLSAPSVVYYSTNSVLVLANTKILVETYDGTTPVIIETVHGNIVASYSAEFQYDTYVYIGKTESTGTVGYSYISQTDKPFVFRFGQEVGLKNNSRTPRNNKIITRISGSGSENNIPYGYPQILWTGNQDWDYTINNDPNNPNSYPIYKGILGGAYVKLIKHPFTRTSLMPSVYTESVNKKVNPNAVGYNPNTVLIDYYDADGSYPNPINPDSPSFEFHTFEGIKPELGVEEIVDAQPNNDTITNGKKYDQMTPAQLDGYLATTINRSRNQNEKDAITRLRNAINSGTAKYTDGNYGGAYTFSCTAEKSGSGYYVDYTSDSAAFHISTVQRSSSGGWDDTMDDDGNYVQSYFNVVLPTLEFDLYACASITQEMQINMRSGACIGCTFNIMVDWEDYKKNFYKEDGTFDPVPHTTAGDGHVRDASKYPDSSQGNITVICQKEISTFGTLMPNIYQQPKTGDRFVILGISLPTSYISSAERRLDDAMLEYMLENNVHYYDYPLKFDEHFLATNTDILLQMRNNTIIRFKYGNEPTMALYIKQMTIKYGYGTLPQYDITLTDDVEIVLNQIGQVTDDVSRMRVQVDELQKYYQNDISSIVNDKLSRVADDVALGRITFQQGIDVAAGAIFREELRSPQFTSGMYDGRGWRIDNLGNAEFESLRIRSFLEVVELIINRLQAQEGDTLFTDNDQIDKVQKVIDPTDQSVSYILSLKEKYDGYITGQMYNNVIKGIINTLAAKQAGVSGIDDEDTVERDGSNTYYTSWMRVIGTHNTNNLLGVNQIQVVLYGDDQVPAQKNFEPCALMTIARWGCVDYSDPEDPDYEEIKASITRRQRVFQISTSEGRVIKYTGVDAPILRDGNYGVTIGELPDFVKRYADVKKVLDQVGEHTDWLYAQGVVVGNYIKINHVGLPTPELVDVGDWINGSPARTVIVDQGKVTQRTVSVPSIGYGIYLYNEYNAETLRYETHKVSHKGMQWQCLQHQPVVSGNVSTYYEPKWNSPYWKLLNGNENITIEFVSSKGYSFRRGNVNTVITPHLFYGNIDITDDVAAEYWNWTRSSESGKTDADRSWDAQHTGLGTGVKTLNLTNNDMPATWSTADKAIFTCTVSVNDGKSTIIVENQIIS